MRIAIGLAAALALFAASPAFAHGGGMGHMGGNMGGNMGGTTGNTTGNHFGDHHDPLHWRHSKTTKTIDKTRTNHKRLANNQVGDVDRLLARYAVGISKMETQKGLQKLPNSWKS
jgi:hypothetical protein